MDADSRPYTSEYPLDNLLPLWDIVKEDELSCPTTLDARVEECIIVVKNGNSTGVTIGRGSGIESFVREYDDQGIHSTSMVVAAYPYSHKDHAFFAPGDSGSIVADGKRRIVGILTVDIGHVVLLEVTFLAPC